MTISPQQLVRQIHDAPAQFVLALNGGSRAVAELLEVPGGSRTLLEATVPYSEGALVAWLGSRPEQFCAARTARAMAVVAFGRALGYGAAEAAAAGIASSASLASDRPKRGPHRAHVALQTAARTARWSLNLEKGARSRAEEERIVTCMVLNAMADVCGIAQRLDLPLFAQECVDLRQIAAPPSWQDLFLGRAEAVSARSTGFSRKRTHLAPRDVSHDAWPDAKHLAERDEYVIPPEGGTTSAPPEGGTPSQPPKGGTPAQPQVVFPGAFNPLHAGHRRMAEVAAEMLGQPIQWEVSILNVDKPPLDYLEIQQRLAQFPPEQEVWLTRADTFDEKSRLFPAATFVVGVDTLQRIADPRYYGNDRDLAAQAIQRLRARGCRFLVFGRASGADFARLSGIELPQELRELCNEVPPDVFREDVSSTRLRAMEDHSHRPPHRLL